jgi:two-component system phosphate regulon sensor histidine kinase PhoR
LCVGDSAELCSAIQNTIENAIKYSSPNTTVTFDWQVHKNNGASLYVRDQGEGIDEQHLTRLTERFYRVDAGRSRDLGGTGLGLSIVKHVMDRHGGQIYIQSELSVGTTVELSFPSSMFIAGDTAQNG